MKTLYVIIFFLVFFNLFAFMFTYLDIFSYRFDPDSAQWNVSENNEPLESNSLFENLTNFDAASLFSLFVFDINDANIVSILVTGLALGGAIALAFITHSPAPLVVGFLANFMFNLYSSSIDVFNQFEINGIVMAVCTVGMFLLFVLTAAEVLTHGDI